MSGDKLGDFHHQNFTEQSIKELLLKYFKDVSIISIPYTSEYCQVNKINPLQPQWIGGICTK
jgi:hypothetical protein